METQEDRLGNAIVDGARTVRQPGEQYFASEQFIKEKGVEAVEKGVTTAASTALAWRRLLGSVLEEAPVVALPTKTASLKPIAVGLSKSFEHRRGLLGRFAEHIGATTYWDEYPGVIPSNAKIVERMVEQFEERGIRVNLSGLTQLKTTRTAEEAIALAARKPAFVTEFEIREIVRRPDFLQKTIWYINGRKVSVDPTRVLELFNGD